MDCAHFSRKSPSPAGKLHSALGLGRNRIAGRRAIAPAAHRLQHIPVLVRTRAFQHYGRMHSPVGANHKAHRYLAFHFRPIQRRIGRCQCLRGTQIFAPRRRPAPQYGSLSRMVKGSGPGCTFVFQYRSHIRSRCAYRGYTPRHPNRQHHNPSPGKPHSRFPQHYQRGQASCQQESLLCD
jgi:hypothetical protein